MLFIILIGIAFALAVFADISHIHILNGILAILALLVTMAAFLTKNYSYLFESILKRKGNNLVLNSDQPFFLAPSGTAIVRREGENVFASSYVKIPIYKSATDMNADEKTDLSKLFGRILTLSKNPVKLSSQLYIINKDSYISKLRTALNAAEDHYRQVQEEGGESGRSSLERARGEVGMWRTVLDSVSKSHSQALALYAMVSALGGNEEEATNIAYQRADELAGGISTILGVTASVVTGEEILSFVEPEYMIPTETVSERIITKTMGGL